MDITPTYPTATLWRFYFSAPQGTTYELVGLWDIYMYSEIGGTNICTDGTVHSSGSTNGPPDNAFDDDPATWWLSINAPAWIEFVFSSAVPIQRYAIYERTSYTEYAPRHWELQYSNDGSTYTAFDYRTNVVWGSGPVTMAFDTPAIYRKYGWLKKRLSPFQALAARWVELSEALEEIWAAQFDPWFDDLVSLRSVYTANDAGKLLIASELGWYYERDLTADNRALQIALRKWELEQKETDIPMSRTLQRMGAAGLTWIPLYALRPELGEAYGTHFYSLGELAALGKTAPTAYPDPLHPPDAFMTSRIAVYIDIELFSKWNITAIKSRINAVKPLHIILERIAYMATFTATMGMETATAIVKSVEIPYLVGITRLGANYHRPEDIQPKVDGTWTLASSHGLNYETTISYTKSGITRNLMEDGTWPL